MRARCPKLNPRRQRRNRIAGGWICAAVGLLLVCAGCRLDMHVQPRYNPYDATDFFGDGQSARMPVAGTVSRGDLSWGPQELLYTGKINGALAEVFPFPVTREVLERGRDRFNIYCTPCHGLSGDGDGMIVQRGFRRSAVVSHRTAAHRARGAFLRRDHERTGRDVSLRLSGSAAGPLGDHRLYSSAATQPAGVDQRCAGSGAEKIAGRVTMSEMENNTLKLERLPMRLVLIGGVLLAVCIAGGMADKGDFFRSYLVAFLFWLGITLGCLAILMMQHLTGGNWALVIRRILEAGSRTLPLMAVAALPLLAGMKTLYVWSRPGQTDPVILAKQWYLNPAFFTGRMIFYFACWFVLAFLLNKWSREEDATAAMHRLDAHGRAERRRTGVILLDGHLRFGRLGDVARAALVFDDLWVAVHGGPGAGGNGVCHHGVDLALRPGAALGSCEALAFPGSRQLPADLRHALGVS